MMQIHKFQIPNKNSSFINHIEFSFPDSWSRIKLLFGVRRTYPKQTEERREYVSSPKRLLSIENIRNRKIILETII